ncbi:MAG: ParB/RepB/Spo0J family partition protein [candidate division WOR-3 bacterium]|nr:ParB/RepB/Spo0J family partition protein [candidate division WOR-3 bacterium]MDW8114004.1 ParB/RepB/Spo0J family partition protein [candidate division WOR-3 bacterium]
MKHKALGKGLSALISEETKKALENEIVYLKIDEIKLNPYQPRKLIDEKSLEELANSIKEKGILQPLVVRRTREGYQLIMGERRLKAARMAGLNEVPVIVKNVSDPEMIEMALIENLHRDDLNPIEEALGYKSLIDEFNYTHEKVAEKVGKERATITNALRLLTLPPKVRDYLASNLITVGHAKILLSLPDRESQESWAEKIIEEGLSVRQLEAKISSLGIKKKKKIKKVEKDPFLTDLEDRLKSFLGTKVNIQTKTKGGTILIEYYSDEDLDRIIKLIIK